jgi:hypothetical protein
VVQLAAPADGLTSRRVFGDACQFRDQLVATHADERANLIHRCPHAMLAERLCPGLRVRPVAVDQRPSTSKSTVSNVSKSARFFIRRQLYNPRSDRPG